MPSANRLAYEASIKAAAVVAVASKATNETAHQGIVAAAGTSVGFRPGWPTGYAAAAAAVAAAAAQKVVDDTSVEQTRQSAESAAKDLLRSQGEIPL